MAKQKKRPLMSKRELRRHGLGYESYLRILKPEEVRACCNLELEFAPEILSVMVLFNADGTPSLITGALENVQAHLEKNDLYLCELN